MAKETPERARLVRMLGKVPLFSGLGEKELKAVADAGRETTFELGKTIIKQGEPGLSFLIVLEGKLEVRRKGKVIAAVVAGGFVGEMTVVDDRPRSADLVAVEKTRCFGITSWSFFPMLRSNPSVAIGIIKELVSRLRRLQESNED